MINYEKLDVASKLDSHWEGLTPEEKKKILRIEKDEVFEVIKNYQSSNNCSCSICGRRNIAMEQELERIYTTLFETSKQHNSDTDFVLFHLNLIKELQHANSASSTVPPSATETNDSTASTGLVLNKKENSPQYLENMRDEAVKYCLSNKAIESLSLIHI